MHKAFEVHRLNEEGIEKAKTIAILFDDLLSSIASLVPPGRELSIVTTHLEEASFFAKKGMANQKENQKQLDKEGEA